MKCAPSDFKISSADLQSRELPQMTDPRPRPMHVDRPSRLGPPSGFQSVDSRRLRRYHQTRGRRALMTIGGGHEQNCEIRLSRARGEFVNFAKPLPSPNIQHNQPPPPPPPPVFAAPKGSFGGAKLLRLIADFLTSPVVDHKSCEPQPKLLPSLKSLRPLFKFAVVSECKEKSRTLR
jgi:hypothetical protein